MLNSVVPLTFCEDDVEKAIDQLNTGKSTDEWVGGLSDSLPINQGVRQGGILSMHLYKIYIDELLNIMKSERLGLKIGTVYVGSPACAEGVALLASSVEELQLMLQGAVRFARKTYKIHPTKT